MTCAVSRCVCIASIVMTAPARSVNAFSRSRTAGISFDFSSTATWPRTAPMPCASAATRCGAFPSLFLAPRTVLPSIGDHQPAADLRGPGPQPGAEDPVEHLSADQGERAPERGLLRRAAGRAQPGQDVRSRRRRPTARSRRTTSTPRSPRRSRRRAARPAGAGGRASSAGPGPGRGDRAGTGCGQPEWAKMSSAGGRPSWQTMVSVRTSIVPPGPRPPPADTPGTSPVATTSQATASLHDFAVSLGCGGRRPGRR